MDAILLKRTLVELTKVHGLLSGRLDPKDAGATEDKPDGANRRELCLAHVNRLGKMLADALEMEVARSEAVYQLAGGRELEDHAEQPQGEVVEKPKRIPFGFAAGRNKQE